MFESHVRLGLRDVNDDSPGGVGMNIRQAAWLRSLTVYYVCVTYVYYYKPYYGRRSLRLLDVPHVPNVTLGFLYFVLRLASWRVKVDPLALLRSMVGGFGPKSGQPTLHTESHSFSHNCHHRTLKWCPPSLDTRHGIITCGGCHQQGFN